jgi:cysteine desulfurase
MFPGTRRNGSPAVPQCANLTFEGIRGETLLSVLFRAGVAASHGSACAALEGKPSHVLAALGLPIEAARRTLRFGLGRFTTPEEIAYVLDTASGFAGRRGSWTG